MVKNDFSQLPIVDKEGKLVGIISEQTIIRLYYHLKGTVSLLDLTVDHCQIPPVTLPAKSDVFDALDRLKDVYAIVITKEQKPIGILTNYDTTRFFRDLSEGLIFVQDIEETLRQHIEAAFPDERAMMAALMLAFGHNRPDTSRPAKEYDSLSFKEHLQLITTERNWDKFRGVFEPKDFFSHLLEPVGHIRNQLAHFRGRLDPVQRQILKGALNWLSTRPKVDLPLSAMLQGTGLLKLQAVDLLEASQSSGSYDRLQRWLEAEREKQADIKITFRSIEELLGEALPPSAGEHRSWWENDYINNAHSLAWLRAGWLIEDVDLAAREVIFHRTNKVLYQLFFADVLERLKAARPGATHATKTQQQSLWWFAAGKTGFYFQWSFRKDTLRTELLMNSGDRGETKRIFDAFLGQRGAIEQEFGATLDWERLDNGKESHIFLSKPAKITDPPAELEETKRWAVDTMIKFVDVFQKRIKRL